MLPPCLARGAWARIATAATAAACRRQPQQRSLWCCRLRLAVLCQRSSSAGRRWLSSMAPLSRRGRRRRAFSPAIVRTEAGEKADAAAPSSASASASSPSLPAPPEMEAASLSPMMQQWRVLKQEHRQHVLLFRMGDFYELFFDDAALASSVLSLTLTSRLGLPMCGFPHYSLQPHLRRLLAANCTVAICEQVETLAASRERKSTLVQREVVRIVTRGTAVDDGVLSPKQSNFLLALDTQRCRQSGAQRLQPQEQQDDREEAALCWIDVSTGVMEHSLLPSLSSLSRELARLSPAEILIPHSLSDHRALTAVLQGYAVTLRPDAVFDSELSRHIVHWQQAEGEPQAEQPQRSSRLHEAEGGAEMESLHPSDLLLRCSPAELRPCAALLDYLVYTQRKALPRLFAPSAASSASCAPPMAIDAATRRSLELTHSLSRHTRVGSLLHSIDHTLTSGGARALSAWLSSPLTDVRRIQSRLDCVDWFLRDRLLMDGLRGRLRDCDDIQRGLQRIVMRKGGGGAREMRAIVRTVSTARDIALMLREGAVMGESEGRAPPAAVLPLLSLLSHPSLSSLSALLDSALVDEPPLLLETGGFIRQSYHPPLSELSSQSSDTQRRITELQAAYRAAFRIPSLKVRRSSGIGYYIELSPVRGEQLEAQRRAAAAAGGGDAGGQHDASVSLLRGLSLFQQLKTEWRYKSTELVGLQQAMLSAAEEMRAIELRLYEELRDAVCSQAALLQSAAQAVSLLDVYSSLAHLAMDHHYVRPLVVEAENGEEIFDVQSGRHPVVEARMHARYRATEKARRSQQAMDSKSALQETAALSAAATIPRDAPEGEGEDEEGEQEAEASSLSPYVPPVYSSSTPYLDFTPNSCRLLSSSSRLWLLTGANMAGKSTFLRQNALIALLASIGSFVPAASLRLTPIDSLFSRIGGAVTDDLSSDQSTFMREMLELADILQTASTRSLVIVDEVGRGTGSFDGLSIALAALEHLHDCRCRCLFATHYHELAEAAAALQHMRCYRLDVEEEQGRDGRGSTAAVTFLHRVVPGVVSSSYGVNVARLAGVPAAVSNRAAAVLEQLEQGRSSYRQLVKRVIAARGS